MVVNTQNALSGRLMAFASEKQLVGYTWTPVRGADLEEAKALAVWLNSTLGRISMRRVLSRELKWPMWQPGALMNVIAPNVRSDEEKKCKEVLCEGFESLKKEELEQYRDGYTTVRRRIDEIVSTATNISIDQITYWGNKLAVEPTIYVAEADAD